MKTLEYECVTGEKFSFPVETAERTPNRLVWRVTGEDHDRQIPLDKIKYAHLYVEDSNEATVPQQPAPPEPYEPPLGEAVLIYDLAPVGGEGTQTVLQGGVVSHRIEGDWLILQLENGGEYRVNISHPAVVSFSVKYPPSSS